MDQRFPGKENPLQKRFYIAVAQRSVEEDDTILSKVAKAEGKTRGKKMEKPQNVLRPARQRIDRQLSKLRLEAIVNVYVSRLVLV